MNTMQAGDFMDESELPTFYNEVDPQEANDYRLRTLVDFEIVDALGHCVNFVDLSSREDKATLVVRGLCLEPQSYEERMTVVNLASSAENVSHSATSKNKKKKQDEEVEEISDPSAIPTLDRDGLDVGSRCDAYCNRTFQWFGGKVVEVGEGHTLETPSAEVKVHFQGWNSAYDDWIPRHSDRLVAAGTAEKLEIYAAKQAEDMVPWFETKDLYKKMREKVALSNPDVASANWHGYGWHPYPNGLISKVLQTQPVTFTGVVDWCIDLSYCNPSLWLISAGDIWYRVAGILNPCGHLGFPSKRYQPNFDSFVQKFEATAHVAYVLLDFYGQNSKITFQDVVAEIVARTKGGVSEGTLLFAHDMIVSQISAMPQHEDWNKKLKKFSASNFMQQVNRYGAAAANAHKWVPKNGPKAVKSATAHISSAAHGQEKKPKVSKVAIKEEGQAEKLEAMLKGRNPRQGILLQTAMSRQSALKYPMLEGDMWDVEFYREKIPLAMPQPSPSSKQLELPNDQVVHMLQAWSLTMNYRLLLDLPYLSLSRFITLMNVNGAVKSDTSSGLPMSPVLREVMCRALAEVLVDKNFGQGLSALGMFEFFPILNSDAIGSYEDARTGVSTSGPFIQLHKPNISGEAQNVYSLEKIQLLLRKGDTWVEVLRMLMSLTEHVDMPEYADPVTSCLDSLLEVMGLPSAAMFLDAVRPDEDGVPDYFDRVSSPMDFTTIRTRISEGYYDSPLACGANAGSVKNSEKESRFGGVRGILRDINLVWSNCYDYWAPVELLEGQTEHPIVALAKECEAKFKRFYAIKVLGMSKDEVDNGEIQINDDGILVPPAASPMKPKTAYYTTRSTADEAVGGSSAAQVTPPLFGLSERQEGPLFLKEPEQNWQSHSRWLAQAATFEEIPGEVRLQIYKWLMCQYMNTKAARDYINVHAEADDNDDDDEVAKARKPAAGAKKKTGRKSKATKELEAKELQEAQEKEEAERLERGDDEEAEEETKEDLTAKPKGKRRGRAPAKPKDATVVEDGEEEEDTTCFFTPKFGKKAHEIDRDGNIRYSRFAALGGGDRHGNRYWAFCFVGPPPEVKPDVLTNAAAANSASGAHVVVKVEEEDADVTIDEITAEISGSPTAVDSTTPTSEKASTSSSTVKVETEIYEPNPVATLDLGIDSRRIFRENPQTGIWTCFSSTYDINRLIGWLDPRGKVEKVTRMDLIRWAATMNMTVMCPPVLGQAAKAAPQVKRPEDDRPKSFSPIKSLKREMKHADGDETESEGEADRPNKKRVKVESPQNGPTTSTLASDAPASDEKPTLQPSAVPVFEDEDDDDEEEDEDDEDEKSGGVSLSYADMISIYDTGPSSDAGIEAVKPEKRKRAFPSQMQRTKAEKEAKFLKDSVEYNKDYSVYEQFMKETEAASVANVMEWENEEDISDQNIEYWHLSELTSVLYVCQVHLTGSLGMAVKETKDPIKGRSVMCIGYSPAPPGSPEGTRGAAEMAGICIGDRLLSCDENPITSIAALQAAVGFTKRAAAEQGIPVVLEILVARTSHSLGWLPEAYSDEALQHAAMRYELKMTKFPMNVAVPSRSLGLLSDILFRCQCKEWSSDKAQKRVGELSSLARFMDENAMEMENSAGSEGQSVLKQITVMLLEVENALVKATRKNKNRKTQRELHSLWLADDRLRYQWRRVLSNATTYGQFCTCATVFGLVLSRPLL